MNLNQVTVQVTNIPRAIDFYQSLGLKLIVKTEHYARFECPIGDATFSVHLENEIQNNNGAWIYFEIDNLDEQVNELVKRGIVFEEMPNNKPWLWREARLKDPDGNQLILYFAGNSRKNPPWRIKDVLG